MAYSISLLLCFQVSYQYGLIANKEKALTESFTAMQKTLANNAARKLITFEKINNLKKHEPSLRCLLKNEVLHLSKDWQYCKRDIECSKNIEGNFYSQTDNIIYSFQKEICP